MALRTGLEIEVRPQFPSIFIYIAVRGEGRDISKEIR